jgi:hypothetical protein
MEKRNKKGGISVLGQIHLNRPTTEFPFSAHTSQPTPALFFSSCAMSDRHGGPMGQPQSPHANLPAPAFVLSCSLPCGSFSSVVFRPVGRAHLLLFHRHVGPGWQVHLLPQHRSTVAMTRTTNPRFLRPAYGWVGHEPGGILGIGLCLSSCPVLYKPSACPSSSSHHGEGEGIAAARPPDIAAVARASPRDPVVTV